MKAGKRWLERAMPKLAPDERLLWRGAPDWRGLAGRVFHIRIVALYFGGLTLADMLVIREAGGSAVEILRAALPTVLTGVPCLLILGALAWTTARTTNYVLTSRRLILQFGVALPATLSIPLGKVAGAAIRVRADHRGDVAIELKRDWVAFLKLWPHVRPWHLGRAQPMLRDVPGLAAVAPLLNRTLLAGAEAPAAAPAPAPAPVRAALVA